jgi:diacylglycerol kinase (ATP)
MADPERQGSNQDTSQDITRDNEPRPGRPPPRSGIARLWPAIRHSLAGVASTLRTETAFRQEIACFMILFPLSLWLGDTTVEKILLAAPLFLVLIVELLNTAVESAVDRWGDDYNDFTKAAKDAGSAAVFISLLLVLFSWTMIVVVPLF